MAGANGGGKDKPGGVREVSSGAARPRKRKLRPCPPDVVRVPAGTDLDVAARVRGVDFFWVDFEEVCLVKPDFRIRARKTFGF